ncbi:unnamed protein product [Rangifer tarandus platyrhynchus]|uniref:Uncharacterized protein n=1 Tax=Rangifer tarandus platyrhynchus TaxID=3082113 RepID=A0AC59ZWN2_RANTA
MAQEQARADWTGGRPPEAPRGGGRGPAGPTPGPGRRQRWPWLSRGAGSSRPRHQEGTGGPHHPEEQLPPASGA